MARSWEAAPLAPLLSEADKHSFYHHLVDYYQNTGQKIFQMLGSTQAMSDPGCLLASLL